ncbi:assimilatory sulfite reductase (NADPH) flavoprotein subunit [soil metagenome]
MQLPDNAPFSDPQKAALNGLLASLTPDQAAYLNGFFGALATTGTPTAPAPATAKTPVTILYGTESGNCEVLADEAKKALAGKGMKPVVKNMADTNPADLAGVENLLVIVSTWGEGDPPDAAVPFHTAFMADGAPRLENTHFTVCALGDTAYEQFCQIGKDFDRRLEDLGAHRLTGRTDCDLDYDAPFQQWLQGAIRALESHSGSPAVIPGVAPLTAAASAAGAFGKRNPFQAELIDRILLSGERSAKETLHFELSLEGSGLNYLPGDSLAVVPSNAPEDIDAFLTAAGLDGDSLVAPTDSAEITLHDALLNHYDITGLTKNVLQKFNRLASSKKIAKLLDPQHRDALNDYLWGRQIVDMLADFRVEGLTSQDVLGILRKLPPRLYSIASSPKAHPGEVHLTVAAVRYHSHGRDRRGVASTYLADRVQIGESIPVYAHASKTFKLPTSPDTAIIMVGPGTGIAPFRAFVEDRAADGAAGKSWLFFGDQHYTEDFLYQLEWQDHLKSGTLSQLDVAFSRDQPEKYYVHHAMRQRARQLYSWLQDGAHFYVCGDASRMAHDVHSALVDIIAEQGGHSKVDAEAYADQLKKDRRYQRDVY